MNAAKLVNIFEITKYFVQKIMFVHEFMNTTWNLNANLSEIFYNIVKFKEVKKVMAQYQ